MFVAVPCERGWVYYGYGYAPTYGYYDYGY